jgi:uncharacterized membrane protein YciS (DUF1049 family)
MKMLLILVYVLAVMLVCRFLGFNNLEEDEE